MCYNILRIDMSRMNVSFSFSYEIFFEVENLISIAACATRLFPTINNRVTAQRLL
jgi:hypothetical protein